MTAEQIDILFGANAESLKISCMPRGVMQSDGGTQESTKRGYRMIDPIERQAAIDTAVEAADEWDGGYSRSREEMITMKLRMLPSAQPLTAHVISDEDGNIKCSNCGSFDCWGNYCMNCGAKMRGAERRTDG